jgi:hypothetical protein
VHRAACGYVVTTHGHHALLGAIGVAHPIWPDARILVVWILPGLRECNCATSRQAAVKPHVLPSGVQVSGASVIRVGRIRQQRHDQHRLLDDQSPHGSTGQWEMRTIVPGVADAADLQWQPHETSASISSGGLQSAWLAFTLSCSTGITQTTCRAGSSAVVRVCFLAG